MPALKSTWHHIRRSPFQSLVAFTILTLTFFVTSIFVLSTQGLNSLLAHFETKPEVTIFLKDGLELSAVENLQKELSSYPSIREIKFISKEKALSIYQEQNKDNPLLTEMVTSSILPASFEVSVSDPQILEEIFLDFSKKNQEIDDIIYQKDIIDSLLSWTKLLRRVGIAAVALFSLISLAIVFVIIGMKITNRKEEIRISRLLGASNFYVKKPFLLEGMIYGLFGGLFGSLTVLIPAFYFKNLVNQFFTPITFLPTDYLFYLAVFSAQLILAIFIGFISSWFGAKRYIKF